MSGICCSSMSYYLWFTYWVSKNKNI